MNKTVIGLFKPFGLVICSPPKEIFASSPSVCMRDSDGDCYCQCPIICLPIGLMSCPSRCTSLCFPQQAGEYDRHRESVRRAAMRGSTQSATEELVKQSSASYRLEQSRAEADDCRVYPGRARGGTELSSTRVAYRTSCKRRPTSEIKQGQSSSVPEVCRGEKGPKLMNAKQGSPGLHESVVRCKE